MTLIASALFIATLLYSTYAVSTTMLKAMPRIEQVIAERNEVAARSRIIHVKTVRSTGQQTANVIAFAPRARPTSVTQNPLPLAA